MPAPATRGREQRHERRPGPERGCQSRRRARHAVAMTQPSSSEGVVTSARARPGERRAARPAVPQARLAAPHLRGHAEPTPGPGRRRPAPAAAPRVLGHRIPPSASEPPRSAARSSRLARCARLFTVPSGTPISSATSATGRSSTYTSRHTSRSGHPQDRGADRLGEMARDNAASAGSLACRPSAAIPRAGPARRPGRRRNNAACRRAIPHIQPPAAPPAGSRARRARPRGMSPAGRPRRRRPEAPTAAGPPAMAHAGRTTPARRRRRQPRPPRSAHRHPSLLYCVPGGNRFT